MPLSSNAPFNEFGQSMILRDIEQLYLALGGVGSGSPGDGATQDQQEGVTQETGDGGGLPDLSQLAGLDYVNDAIATLNSSIAAVSSSIPSVAYPIAIDKGGTGQITQQLALNALAGAVTANRALVADGSNVAIGQVTRSTLSNGTACTVIGRSANSTGVVADISGAANQVLACSGTPALAFSRTITLGDTSNAGSITIGNSTSASAIVLDTTLINAAGKILSVREIDVCDAGVAKKMLVLASAPY